MANIDEILQKINDRVMREPEFKSRLEQTPIEVLNENGISFFEEDERFFLGELESTSEPPVHLSQTPVISDILARVSPKCLALNSRVSPKCAHTQSPEET